MKPQRNEPCPCGSGKKYKKCCYQNGKNVDTENQLKLFDLYDDYDDDDLDDDDYDDDSFHSHKKKNDDYKTNFFDDDDDDDYFDDDHNIGEQAILLRAMNNMRKFLFKDIPHMREYEKIRKMHGEIVGAMVNFYHSGKFKQKENKDPSPQTKDKQIVYLFESKFDLDSQLEAQCFYDIFIYKTASNVNCITEDYIENKRFKKPEKIEFLHSMLNSSSGLFEITGTDFDEGYAYIKEVFTGKEYTIVDIGLSGQKNYGDYYIYTRIITYNGISFGSGLNLVFRKTDGFIKNHIKNHKKNYTPNGEFLRFSQLYKYLSKTPLEDRVPFITI